MRHRIIAAAAALCLLAGAALAQDTTAETYVFSFDGPVVTLQEGWEAYTDDEGYTYLRNDDTEVFPDWYTPSLFRERELVIDTVEEMAEYYLTGFENLSVPYDPDEVLIAEAEGGDIAIFETGLLRADGTSFEMIAFVRLLPDGTALTFQVYPQFGDTLNPESAEQAFDIIASAETLFLAEEDTFSFADPTITVTLPAGWRGFYDDKGFLYFATYRTSVFPDWYTPDLLRDRGLTIRGIAAMAEHIMADETNLESPFDSDLLQTYSVGDAVLGAYSLRRMREDETSYESVLLLTRLLDGTYVVLEVYPTIGDTLDALDLETAEAILTSAVIDN